MSFEFIFVSLSSLFVHVSNYSRNQKVLRPFVAPSDLVFNKDTNLDFKFELLLNPIHPFML